MKSPWTKLHPWLLDAPLCLVLLCCCLAGCRPRGPSVPAPGASLDPTHFCGEKALEKARRFVNTGPRVSGTPAAEKAARALQSTLTDLGLDARVHTFQDLTPSGTSTFHNVVATLEGTADERIVLVSHYDTKDGIAPEFSGANDSGSSTGALLELARVLASGPRLRHTIQLAFVDGEECRNQYGPNDGLHGSRELVRSLVAAGLKDRVRAAIVLDMIGDRDLTVTLPGNSTPDLTRRTLLAARAAGVRSHFSLYEGSILDDHVPFLEAGMPAIDIIDFEFGSGPGKNDYWHTPEDTMDKLSAESLEAVGRTVIHLLNDLCGE